MLFLTLDKTKPMLNIVLFGPPGAGKGTQSQKLIEKYKLQHVSTGDLLRGEIAEKTPLGLSAKNYLDSGILVPDEVVIGMVKNKIEKDKKGAGFIFDGFPRTVPQAAALEHACAEAGIKINGMVALAVDEEELTKRIVLRGKTSGRSDDQDPVLIKQRVSEYTQKTAPVASYYTKEGKYFEVDGMNSVDQVFTDICKIIDSF